MDDRNLVAVAEQAAATSRVLRSPLQGCTILFDDGQVFLGCRMEYEDASLDQDAVANALAAGRVEGAYRPHRIGVYSPLSEGLPEIPRATLERLLELGSPDLKVVLSPGTGRREERSLADLLAAAQA
ncbi:MAG: hypothetical protein ACYTF3_05025 [Planctomycetota bacterium]|jgi:cytidine deaminase